MIQIKNLKYKYSGNEEYAIDDVTFSIEKGKYVAIIGHNGSGKSTLSKLIVGLYKPVEGEYFLGGIKIQFETLNLIRQKIGMVFQNPDNQFVGSTVEDDIAFGLENHNVSREKMIELIDVYSKKVNMHDYLNYEPHHLSGGQKQRVAIASTLALEPEIIIFDEVTSMLDPKSKSEILGIIKDIREKRNRILISVTHDMDEAILADEVIVMCKGKIIAKGAPEDILNDPQIISAAKLEMPFFYKLSSLINLNEISKTYDKDFLLEQLCK